MTDFEAIHRHSSCHREAIRASSLCGCFYCCATFTPGDIEEWIDERNGVGQTALCPKCGIDSVLGSSSGFRLTPEFLEAMHKYWF